MGKANAGRGGTPPPQNFRQKVGQHKAKLDRKEKKETHNMAVARKQEPVPVQKVLLWLGLFGAVCACLYAYLNFVLADEEDDEIIAAAEAAARTPDATPEAEPSAAAAVTEAG